mgnify:CR=1 FL=1
MPKPKKVKKKKKENVIARVVKKVKNSPTVKAAENISKNVTKKHNIIKNKRFNLKGQVDLPKVGAKWNSGNPKVSIKNSGNLSASYKVNKNISLSGGVNYETGKKPKYKVGVKIKIGTRKKR